MSIIKADDFITTKARQMRKEMTKYEKMLWFKISNQQLGAKFRKQVPLLNIYIVDFVCFDKKLIIEIDGSQHATSEDLARDKILNDNGFEVIRFWNNEIYDNLEGCIELVIAVLNNPT